MQLRDKRVPITAEQLSDEERESVWGRLCENVPNYSAYREKTDRDIKVYRWDPRDSAATPT